MDGSSPGSPILYDGNGSVFYTPGLSENQNGTSFYYHADALGSTRGLTDSSGGATGDAFLFDAFGELVNRTGSTQTEAQFAGTSGYRTDKDSKLLLLGPLLPHPQDVGYTSPDARAFRTCFPARRIPAL